MIEYSDYTQIIGLLKDQYGLAETVEHKYIHKMSEGNVELFRFMFGYNTEKQQNELYASFHLDINPIDAIIWYKRLEHANPKVKLVDCYFRDGRDEVYTGQEAEVIRMYIQEQAIIANWDKSQKETEKFIKAKVVGRKSDEVVCHDPNKAIEVFSKMVQNDDDTEH
jgi:intein-encoded DNA endonuclease-like protein